MTTQTEQTETTHGTLTDYQTGESIRPATAAERAASLAAAKADGGAGVIRIDGRSVYVADSIDGVVDAHTLRQARLAAQQEVKS
jgi:hypothetical protein